MTPLTVLMSVYNEVGTVSRAVHSILDQSFRDFQFVIIDDGSTDGTTDVLEELAGRDSRIELHVQENTGLTAALNRGLSLAVGKYIARQDADDVSKPSRLERQYVYLQAHPGTVLLGTDIEYRDESGQFLSIVRNSRRKRLQNRLLESNQFAHGSLMFPARINGECVRYHTYYRRAQDYDLCLRLSELGEIAAYPEALYIVCHRRSGISLSNSDFFGNVARSNALARRAGVAESFPPEVGVGERVGRTEGRYYLECAVRCASGYETSRAIGFALCALRSGMLSPAERRRALYVAGWSLLPKWVRKLLRER